MRAVLLAAALFLAACGSKPAPVAEPAPVAAATVAPITMPAEGDRHEIRVERDKVVVVDGGELREIPDLHTAVDSAALKQALDELGLASAPVVLSDDAAYGRAVAAMEVVNALGGDPALTPPPAADDPAAPAARSDGSPDLKDWPVIVVTAAGIELRGPHTASARLPIADLERMLVALAPFPGGAVLEANTDTSGALVNQVLRSVSRAGIPKLLLAVNTSNTPVRRP